MSGRPKRVPIAVVPDEDSDGLTDEEIRDRGAVDDASARINEMASSREEAQRTGSSSMKSLPQSMDGAGKYETAIRVFGALGGMKVCLKKIAPVPHEYPYIDTALVQDYGDFLSYVQTNYWDGTAMQFSWKLKTGGIVRAVGEISLGQDLMRKEEIENRRKQMRSAEAESARPAFPVPPSSSPSWQGWSSGQAPYPPPYSQPYPHPAPVPQQVVYHSAPAPAPAPAPVHAGMDPGTQWALRQQAEEHERLRRTIKEMDENLRAMTQLISQPHLPVSQPMPPAPPPQPPAPSPVMEFHIPKGYRLVPESLPPHQAALPPQAFHPEHGYPFPAPENNGYPPGFPTGFPPGYMAPPGYMGPPGYPYPYPYYPPPPQPAQAPAPVAPAATPSATHASFEAMQEMANLMATYAKANERMRQSFQTLGYQPAPLVQATPAVAEVVPAATDPSMPKFMPVGKFNLMVQPDGTLADPFNTTNMMVNAPAVLEGVSSLVDKVTGFFKERSNEQEKMAQAQLEMARIRQAPAAPQMTAPQVDPIEIHRQALSQAYSQQLAKHQAEQQAAQQAAQQQAFRQQAAQQAAAQQAAVQQVVAQQQAAPQPLVPPAAPPSHGSQPSNPPQAAQPPKMPASMFDEDEEDGET